MTATNARTPLVTPAMLVTFARLSAPVWVSRVGLYPYLALEIMIWMIFSRSASTSCWVTAACPPSGTAPSLGVGADAFGLLQLKLGAGLVAGLAGAVLVAALAGAVVGALFCTGAALIPPFSLSPSGRVLAGFIPRSNGTASPAGRTGCSTSSVLRPQVRPGVRFLLVSNTALHFFTFAMFVLVVLFVAADPFAVGPRAAGGEAERDRRCFPGSRHRR